MCVCALPPMWQLSCLVGWRLLNASRCHVGRIPRPSPRPSSCPSAPSCLLPPLGRVHSSRVIDPPAHDGIPPTPVVLMRIQHGVLRRSPLTQRLAGAMGHSPKWSGVAVVFWDDEDFVQCPQVLRVFDPLVVDNGRADSGWSRVDCTVVVTGNHPGRVCVKIWESSRTRDQDNNTRSISCLAELCKHVANTSEMYATYIPKVM